MVSGLELSAVLSEKPHSSPNESTEIEEITDKAIFQLQKNLLDQKKQIQLCFYLDLKSNSGMLFVEDKELAQSGKITI
jgi:hypothetical protein